MDGLLELIIKDDINIHHNKVVEFGILKLNSGTINNNRRLLLILEK